MAISVSLFASLDCAGRDAKMVVGSPAIQLLVGSVHVLFTGQVGPNYLSFNWEAPTPKKSFGLSFTVSYVQAEWDGVRGRRTSFLV